MSRTMFTGFAPIAVVGILLSTTRAAEAQHSRQTPAWEFLVSSGAVVPTGADREAITRGNLTAAQTSCVVRPGLAVTATLGWARSRDLAYAGSRKLDLFTFDLGAERRGRHWTVGGTTFRPFVGAGAGARIYNYRNLHLGATHHAAAYIGAGGELGIRRVRLHVEARDYVTGVPPLGGNGATRGRNDLVVMARLRFARR